MKSPVHLNALRAFEASARHQSFSGAATELHVTPAAVGQLVRTLEDWLGTLLFVRATRGRTRLVPTEAAQRALSDIRAGFDKLALGLEQLRDGAGKGVLTVTVSPAFAAKWLLPRIDEFQATWPDLDLRLNTNLKPIDFVEHKIDVGVRYGTGAWPGLHAEKLMDEEVYPVCSAQFLSLFGPLQTPSDLGRATLIHDLSMEGHADFPSWSKWIAKAGAAVVVVSRGLRINSSAAVLQAAIEGYGVALARSVMAHDDVASGCLIRLFPEVSFASPLGYYFVYRKECSGVAKLAAFRDWMFAQARRSSSGQRVTDLIGGTATHCSAD